MTLTPLAVSHQDVLRHLLAHPGDGHLAIAKATGRVASNVKRDMPRLRAEGLVGERGGLTGAGLEILRALERAEGAASGSGPPPAARPSDPEKSAPAGYAELIWMQIDPDPLNPRKHFDPEAIEELADSIAKDGLLENLVVRAGVVPADPYLVDGDGRGLPMHRLVAGERRHRAIKRLIERGVWLPGQPILCKIADVDDAGHRRLALVENLQRKDLRPIDEANALKELMAVTGAGTAEVAAEIGFTQRFVQQRLQLLELPAKLQDQVNEGQLPIETARSALAILPKLPANMQAELEDGEISVEDARDWLKRQPPALALTPRQRLIALELTDAMERRPLKKAAYEYDRTEVGQGARKDGDLTQLAQLRLVGGVSEHQDKHYDRTGRLYVSAAYEINHFFEEFGSRARPSRDALQALLASARAEAGIAGDYPAGTYVTAWLNPPFEVPQAIAEKYAATLAARKTAEAKGKAEAALHSAAADARKASAAANAEVVHQLVTEFAARPPVACDPRFAEVLAKAGLPAPWRVEARGRVVAADGAEVFYPSWYLDEQPWILAQRVLMAAAINLAAGVSFTVEPDADEDAEEADDELDDDAQAADDAAEPVSSDALKRLAGIPAGEPAAAAAGEETR